MSAEAEFTDKPRATVRGAVDACAQQEIAADGGQPTDPTSTSDESCAQCAALNGFPCWECVRTGRHDTPEEY
jgi:hypothetical protein